MHTHPESIVRGGRSNLAKLTDADVLEIRRRYAEGALQRELAAAYGIRQTNVSQIVRRQTWTHL